MVKKSLPDGGKWYAMKMLSKRVIVERHMLEEVLRELALLKEVYAQASELEEGNVGRTDMHAPFTTNRCAAPASSAPPTTPSRTTPTSTSCSTCTSGATSAFI